jgi:uncharacterized protein (TIGR02217 family)
MAFHELRFPTAISFGATGGPERRTDVVSLASGYEERNQRWADSRRTYNAGYGVKTADDLHKVIEFFEERRGRLHGFRWKDQLDHKSCAPLSMTSPFDQHIGTGDGTTATFQLTRRYGSLHAPYKRAVRKPVVGSVRVAVDGGEMEEGTDFICDAVTGMVTFQAGAIPFAGAAITAGFEFDVPVRFDTDKIEASMRGLGHGEIPHIPIVEIRL